ncbi:hypothetical protein [Streptomyces sp. NPDC058665]|uniref:SCO2400 family protein n=1 Tax=Streptomyces sp. NPDC058665 TaxID=3346586 RepID=UPI0036503DB3
MDYCHHCRRHLNGALACAGCGTPAEELRLHDPAPHEAEVVLAAPDHSDEPVVGARRQRGSRKRKMSRRERRQLRAERGAGVHRRRGRTVLVVVMSLVLAVGALSLAELALESSGDDGDATSVQEDRAIEVDGGPPPSGPPKPKDPGPVEGTPSGSAGSARPGGGNGSPDPSGSGTGTGPSDGESPSATDSPDPSDTPDDPGKPTGSTSPTGGSSTPGKPGKPSTPQPSTSTTPPEEEEDDCVLWIICV